MKLLILMMILSMNAMADQYYQAPDQSLHFLSTQDIANGGTAFLPSGSVPITDAQASTIQAQKASALSAAQAKLPNPNGFIQAVKVGMGGIVASNKLSAAYPLFFSTVLEANWADTQALILDAKTNNVINATQYAAIQAAAVQYNIPLILP